MLLSSDWNNEAYVSLHLVQEILEEAGLPKRSNLKYQPMLGKKPSEIVLVILKPIVKPLKKRFVN